MVSVIGDTIFSGIGCTHSQMAYLVIVKFIGRRSSAGHSITDHHRERDHAMKHMEPARTAASNTTLRVTLVGLAASVVVP
jgi:hypothetical protein